MNYAIASPVYGALTHTGFARSLAETYRTRGDVTWLAITNCADVNLARNTLLAEFRHAKVFDVLVWIDADEAWTPEDFEAVTAPIEAGKAHVVSGLVPRKQIGPLNYAIDFFPDDLDPELGYIGPKYECKPYRSAASTRSFEYARLRKCGCGFLALTREALEVASKLAPAYQPWATMAVTGAPDEEHAWMFGSGIVDHRYQSEDYQGCNYLRQAGYETWVSLDARIMHFSGPFRFGGSPPDFDGFAKRMARTLAVRGS